MRTFLKYSANLAILGLAVHLFPADPAPPGTPAAPDAPTDGTTKTNKSGTVSGVASAGICRS